MPEIIGRLSIAVGRRHPVTLRKASYRTPSTTQVLALRRHTGAQYSAAKLSRDRAAVHSVLAALPHSELVCCFSSVTHYFSFFAQCCKMVAEREPSVHKTSLVEQNGKSLMLL